MNMFSFVQKGDFSKTNNFLERAKRLVGASSLDRYGRMGVEALRQATPKDSGTTANSWYYEIEESKGSISIVWKNSNVNKGEVIAVLIQYGHGTGTGGYVSGVDYINPAMRSVFQDIADSIWEEVNR